MEKIENKYTSSAPDIEDATVLTSRNRIAKRYAVWLAALAVIVIFAVAWATNHFYIEPKGDAALISKALQQLESTEHGKGTVEALTKRNSSDRLALTFLALSPGAGDVDNNERVKGYLAALRVAIRADIPEAKLRLAIALRDGLASKRDIAAALKIFDEVSNEMEAGVRAGDPVAMYVTALMLKEGYGRQPDRLKAIELAKRAVVNLDGWRLELAGFDLAFGLEPRAYFEGGLVFSNDIFEGHSDPAIIEKVASRLIAQKVESGPDIGAYSCRDQESSENVVCTKSWFGLGVNAGFDRYIQRYALAMLRTGEPLKDIDEMFARGDKRSDPHDRYIHSVVRSMLASDDKQFMQALLDMWKHVTLHTGLPDAYSLKVGAFGLEIFHTALLNPDFVFTPIGRPATLTKRDLFLIAANVRGILMGREQWMQENLQSLFSDRSDIAKRAQSPEILLKSRAAAEAILSGLSSDKVTLGISTPVDTIDRARSQVPTEQRSTGPNNSVPVTSSQSKPASSLTLTKDPEQQDRTGYLKGQPRAAIGGLSSFTVDNRQGDRDAVARIYLNGKKPAVRSMYVKQGEVFRADAILPGTYVFRYRFIGSEDTFESDKDFSLTQTETETGTRYSNVTVTLFKVKDGNMSTRKVDPNTF